MSRILKDPLLDIAKVILIISMGVFGIFSIGALMAIPFMVLNKAALYAELVEKTPNGPASDTIYLLMALAAMIAVMAALLFLFFRHIKRIVDSVAHGDPFISENATRLTAMAWLMLAVQFVLLPFIGLALYVTKRLGEDAGTVDAAIDPNAVIMVIVLFILARVFRHGTQMRDDLEGTV